MDVWTIHSALASTVTYKIYCQPDFWNSKCFQLYWLSNLWEKVREICPGGWTRELRFVLHAVTRTYIRRSIGVQLVMDPFVPAVFSAQSNWKASAQAALT